MTGRLYGLGVGPGDPELLTLKAHRILTAVPVVAYLAPDTGESFARRIVARFLSPSQREIPIVVPMRVERFPARAIYDEAARQIGAELEAGSDVAVLCEGDPFFYGSFMYVFERLSDDFAIEVVPGVSSMMAGACALGRPLAARNDILTVLPAPLDDRRLEEQIDKAEAAVIIKVGRHFSRVRDLLQKMNLIENSGYLERISLVEERVLPLCAVGEAAAPYFSMIIVYKGAENWAATGREGDAR